MFEEMFGTRKDILQVTDTIIVVYTSLFSLSLVVSI